MAPTDKANMDIRKIRDMMRRKEPYEDIINEIHNQAEVADPKTKNIFDQLIAITRRHMDYFHATGKRIGDYDGTIMVDSDYDLPPEKVIEEVARQRQIVQQVLNVRREFRELDECFMNLQLRDDKD